MVMEAGVLIDRDPLDTAFALARIWNGNRISPMDARIVNFMPSECALQPNRVLIVTLEPIYELPGDNTPRVWANAHLVRAYLGMYGVTRFSF